MSSTRINTPSGDGRFVLRYRHKDSWGDTSMVEEQWRLVDARYDCEVVSWVNEGEREYLAVAFADDERSVRAETSDRVATFALPVLRSMPPEELALRDAVFAAPDDDVPRSVYADWLCERGEPRGEVIALQLGGRDASAILEQHRFAILCDDGLPLTRKVTFARGFVDELRLQVLRPGPLEQLLAVPAIACLQRLDLSFSIGGDTLVAQLTASPRLERLRRLDLFNSDISDAGIAALAASPRLAGLERVTLGHHNASEAALAALRAARPGLSVTKS